MYKNFLGLKNKLVIVTGSSGYLGLNLYKGLISQDAKIILLDKKKPSIRINRSKSKFFECNLDESKEVEKRIKVIENTIGPIDVLINNAVTRGSSEKKFYESFTDYDAIEWENIIKSNINLSFNITKYVLKFMKKRKKGSIIFLSSIYGSDFSSDPSIYYNSKNKKLPFNNPPSYQVSKSAVVGLTRYLCANYGKYNIRINSISPGGIYNMQNKDFVNKYSSRVPLKRMAKPEEIVNPILFLCSDASSYITGQNLYVDGVLSSW